MTPRIDILRDKASQLPLAPGVYLYKDASGEILYAGKAKTLRNRVRSYFNEDRLAEAKTGRLIHAAHDLGGMVFGNAVAVPDEELWMIAAVAALCAGIHLAFSKEFAFASFDPETARALGMRVKSGQSTGVTWISA